MTLQKKSSCSLDVSIVLACYNASSYIVENVEKIVRVLNATRFRYELIFVDDKSSDNTAAMVEALIQKHQNGILLRHTHNKGRGAAVSQGFRQSQGEIVGFIDLDLDNPARYIFSMILAIKYGGADVATARRIYLWSFNLYLIIRFIASRAYAHLASFVLEHPFKDTETGCKFFKREKLISILDKTKSQDWFWDTEIMVRAYYKDYRVVEIPTLFVRDNIYSTVCIIPDALRYLHSIVRFIPVKNDLKLKAEASRREANFKNETLLWY